MSHTSLLDFFKDGEGLLLTHAPNTYTACCFVPTTVIQLWTDDDDDDYMKT